MRHSQKAFEVRVKPEVMKWAILSSGWKIEELSRRMKVTDNTLRAWMSGESSPTLRELEDMAHALRRPLSAFFLPEPPLEKPAPPDFRMLPDKTGEFDRNTILAIRKARRYQRIARELLQNLDSSLDPTIDRVTLSRDPRIVASYERRKIGMAEEGLHRYGSPYEAFKTLRDCIEEKNILVFQMQMPTEDARGFVLVDDRPAVIVANSSDQIEARIFTLAHEYAHVLLNQSSVDMPGARTDDKTANKTEMWCNEFASEFLLAKETLVLELKAHPLDFSDYEALSKLSRKYRVSKSMLAYKMLRAGIIDKRTYTSIMEDLESRVAKKPEEGGGAATKEDRCLREKGNSFVSLVSRNVEKGTIGYHEAIDFLSVNLQNIDRLLAKAEK